MLQLHCGPAVGLRRFPMERPHAKTCAATQHANYLPLPTVARLNYQIILYFKSGLRCYSKHHFHGQPPRFYPQKLAWKHYHVQPTSPQLSAPTSRRSLATTDRSAPRSTAPPPTDFFLHRPVSTCKRARDSKSDAQSTIKRNTPKIDCRSTPISGLADHACT